MATVIELDVDVITEEKLARAIVRLLEALPDFDPQRYDLNQRGAFRGWDVDRAVVDLLTQRTQLFTVQGAGGEAFVATGKHGEPPTIALSCDLDDASPLLAELPVLEVRTH